METRVALIGIIVEEESSVAALNELLHRYAPYIIGRMGLPYRQKGVSIISVVLDAPAGHHFRPQRPDRALVRRQRQDPVFPCHHPRRLNP